MFVFHKNLIFECYLFFWPSANFLEAGAGERSRRVNMKVSIFSPDGKNFCQLMTPNFPKPAVFAHFHPRLLGGIVSFCSATMVCSPIF